MQKVKASKNEITRVIQSYRQIEKLMEDCRQILQQNASLLQSLCDGHESLPLPPSVVAPVGRLDLAILEAFKSCAAAGVNAVPREWLAILARVSPKSGMYKTALAGLLKSGWVRKAAIGSVALTEQSAKLDGPPAQPLTTKDIGICISDVFKAKDAEILLALLKDRGEVSRESLFENPASSASRDRLTQLRKQGFVEFGANQTVRLTLEWFTPNTEKKA